jgi:DNA-binding NarL/FixJ family response regulator
MCSILIVEGSFVLRESLRDMLKARFPSINIIEASDADEALFHVQNSDPDLVFLDVRLPGQSGLELTEMIKRVHPDVEVIVVSMFDMAEYREAAIRRGAGHFFASGSAPCDEIAGAVAANLASRSKECRAHLRWEGES